MPSTNPTASFRFKPASKQQLDELASWYGISLAAAVELAVACLHQAGPPPVPTVELIRSLLPGVIEQTPPPTGKPRGRPRKQKEG